MNDLGMSLAWSAVQVALVMVPVVALHVLASRRSPASGSWIAVVGLELSVAISALAFIPRPRRGVESPGPSAAVAMTAAVSQTNHNANVDVCSRQAASPINEPGRHAFALSLTFAGFRDVFRRLEQGAVVPAARLRRWGTTLAVIGIAGSAVGLFRLVLGLWAVRLCRRRGTIMDDPRMIALFNEIRQAMGCDHRVEIRVVPELITPATAGWWHPVLLLPDDWQSWNELDRRAVLAHELAHIQRWDYAAGLVARLALALEFYHPLVHWMAGRLQLQQELAADAVAARFAGGRGSYLRTLSRLALKQDGRFPSWPARAFLPAPGTLIRRIAMLRDESVTVDRPWSRPSRLLVGLCLLGLAVLVATLRGPAWAGEGETLPRSSRARRVAPSLENDAKVSPAPFDLQYVSAGVPGIIAFRPAAIFRHPGLMHLAKEFEETWIPMLAKQCNVDLPRTDRLKLGLEDVEWVTTNLNFGKGGKNKLGVEMPRLMMGAPIAVRTTKPFDWLSFLRGWRFEFDEVHEGDRVYYKVTGVARPHLGGDACVYLPDERTVVFSDERTIRILLGRPKHFLPAHLASTDWERVSRGLLAVAVQNQDGQFAKAYDLGRPDDAVVLSLFKGVDRWVFGVDDADPIALHATAACRGDASGTIARAVESVVKMWQDTIVDPEPGTTVDEFLNRGTLMFKTLLTNLRVEHDDLAVDVRAEGFGTLAEFGAVVETEINDDANRKRDKGDRSK